MKELILINLGGSRYGVWKGDVLSVRDVDGVHGIPMSTELFSGIAGIEGRTANLFDLAACLGHEPFDRKRLGRALVMSEKGRFEGFVFDSEVGRIEAAPEDVLPMPDCLESPEVTECVHDSGEAVPIINIALLYKRIREKRWKPCVYSFPKSPHRGSKSFSGVFRAFTIEGEVFAVPDEAVEPGAGEPGLIHPLPTAPPHVQGVAFQDGSVRAVINLARYMGRDGFAERGRMMLAKDGGPAFVVGEDMGRLRGNASHAPMPRIAASGFIGHALLRKGDVVPILDVKAAVSRNPAKVFSKKYTPRSRFYESFGKKEARVQEFSFNGLLQSVPDPQVEDIVGVKPWREMRGVHPMMVGVSEHAGEVLPVLDLSACFGRRTKVGQGAKMMLLKNGNFRALVLAEKVLGRRTLAVPEQRMLPIRLPQLYVYGCYTHNNSVRLILNVEALTSHFDEKLVSEYLEMVSKEIEASESMADGPEAGRKAAGAAPTAGAYPAEAASASAVSSSWGAEATGDDAFDESGEEETSEFVAASGETGEENEPVKEELESGPYEEDTPEPVASFDEAEAEGDAAAGAASFGEAGTIGDDAFAESGEEEVSEFVASLGEEEREKEPLKEDAEAAHETVADTATGVASFGEAGATGDETIVEHGKDEISEPAASFKDAEQGDEPAAEDSETAEATDDDTFYESGEEETSEFVAASGRTGQDDEPVKEEMESGPYEEETLEPAASFSEAEGDAAAPPASFGGAGGEDALVKPGEEEDEASEAATFFKEAAHEDEAAAEDAETGAGAAETVVSYGKTDRLEQPAEEQVMDSPGEAAGEKTVVDASPETFRSLDEPDDEGQREGEAPPPPGESLAASYREKERNLAIYAGAFLLLFLAILVFAYLGGRETERVDEEVASLADTKETWEETAPPEEEIAMREPEGEALTQKSREEIAPPEEEIAMREPEGEALTEESWEETSSPEEPAPGPEMPAAEPPKKVETGKPRDWDRRASLLMELGPEKGEIFMRAVDTAPPNAKVYEVVKGDTLWHIARRFTGNPFNYPRIARDSEIKNPDLIFPGQKVYIRIKAD